MIKEFIRTYGCFNAEQQMKYNKLSAKERVYVDNRGRGVGKAESIRRAGYNTTYHNEVARQLEKRKPQIKELYEIIQNSMEGQNELAQVEESNLDVINRVLQSDTKSAEWALKANDTEISRRISFYNSIINGELKTTKIRQEVDPETGLVVKKYVEEVDSIETRMKAREKLDEILGVNTLKTLSQFKVKDITVKFVDASKPDEVEDARNKIDLNVVEANAEEVSDVDEG